VLADQGAQEVILVAQDTTAYGRDLGLRDGLPVLLEEILAACPNLPGCASCILLPATSARV